MDRLGARLSEARRALQTFEELADRAEPSTIERAVVLAARLEAMSR